MTLRLALATLHLLALGIGLGAVHARAGALRRLGASPHALRDALRADAWWGVAALLWVGTGLWRALAGTEKASGYYWSHPVFHAKLGLFALVFALELRPIVVLTRWRRAARAGGVDAAALAAAGRAMARTSDVQTALVVLIVAAATAMARGYGARP